MNFRKLTFSALCVALAVITNYLTFIKLPYGGSITLFSMFFIVFVAYTCGTKYGLIAGFSFGVLNLFLGGYVVHPIQLVLDYFLAFTVLGLGGIFKTQKFDLIKGYIFAVSLRYICAVISGVVFFSSYAGDMNVLVYSIIYNGSYIIPEAILTIVVLFIPVVSKTLKKIDFKLNSEQY